MARLRGQEAGSPNGVVVVLLCLVTTVTAAAFAIPLIVEGVRWKDRTQPLEGGVSTEGRVVRVIVDDSSKGGETYRAVVEYADAAGARYQITNKAGDERPDVGEVVQVSYDPSDPGRAHDLTTGRGTWKLPFVTGVFIVGFCVLVDLIVIVVTVRDRRKAAAP